MALQRTDPKGREWPHGLPPGGGAPRHQALAATQGPTGDAAPEEAFPVICVVANCHTTSGSHESQDRRAVVPGSSIAARARFRRECMTRVLQTIPAAWRDDDDREAQIPSNYEWVACGDFNLEWKDADRAMKDADCAATTTRDGQCRMVHLPEDQLLENMEGKERDFGASSSKMHVSWEHMRAAHDGQHRPLVFTMAQANASAATRGNDPAQKIAGQGAKKAAQIIAQAFAKGRRAVQSNNDNNNTVVSEPMKAGVECPCRC